MVMLSDASETMVVNMDGEEFLRDESAVRCNDDNAEETRKRQWKTTMETNLRKTQTWT